MESLTYTLGVDPAKHKFTACLFCGRTEVFAPRDFEASRQGFEALEALLLRSLEAAPGARLVVGIEASASYDDNLLAFFRELSERVALVPIRVDSAQVKRFGWARPTRGKTDVIDARRVALFTCQFAQELDRFELDEGAQQMQRVVNERLWLAGELVALRNALRDRLIAAFPEFERVMKDPTSDLALAVLEVVPTARAAARKRTATLATIQARKHGERLGEQRAQEIIAQAKRSIASAVGEHEERSIRRHIERIALVRRQIKETEEELREFAALEERRVAPSDGDQERTPTLSEEIRLVDSIPGIAVVGASVLVLRSRGIRRFTSPKALSAQLGTCPARNQTGSSRDGARLTNRGDRRARAVLYQLTLAAIRSDPAMAFHHWHGGQKGLTGKQSVCACMNRMTRIIHGVVRSGREYDPIRGVENIQTHHPGLWKTFLQEHPEWRKKVRSKAKGALT